ncbi:hypothetical protein OH738_03360 [Streptomyces hirsutus]|uniref:Uncharacterized protein n=1 Tax=Streptomyces hirsutus TaxID=35620 RepID=A0ABZ1GWT8_9ACTN|nr:hypothetical protein [Streptomyces hirsutus]WSD10692.1 hypothetical protein OIE73_36665 [Streptomyces hirsutus]WTD15961.1 hypothetical protein OH738_03360 [Streptomyces hirsutus]
MFDQVMARIAGRFGRVEPRAGARVCLLGLLSNGPGAHRDEPVAQCVMAGGPRTTALFGGLPEGDDQGLTRATRDGRQSVFHGHVQGSVAADKAAVERSFKSFAASVGNRIGCEPGSRA